jgi:hypothetical protein
MTFIDLSRDNATITGGTIDGINSLGVVNNIDGLLRTTINNQSSGVNARTDFVQSIGGSTARSIISGIRQIAGSDVGFVDSRGNLPFEQRLSFAENNYLIYRRNIANQAFMQIGDSSTEIGINGGHVSGYRATFGAVANNHTALFRCPTGGFASLMVWNMSNGETLKCTNSGVVFGGGSAVYGAANTATKTIVTPSTTDTITVANAAVGDMVSLSRGANGFVSAANTVQFDSTGLAGVTVRAVVSRVA